MMTLSRIYRGIDAIKDRYLYQLGHFVRAKLVLPEQTSGDRKIFKQVFGRYTGKSLRVFEWGTGYSTVYYGRHLLSMGVDFEWHTIDNSSLWRDNMACLVERYRLTDRVHLHLSEFSAFWELPDWSWQEIRIPEGVCSPSATEYVEYPRRLAGEKGFDVIIVDGRFRKRSLEVAAEVLAPDGLVLLHDAQKSHYHSSLSRYQFGHFFESGRIFGSKVRIKTWVGARQGRRLTEIKSILSSMD